jgi:hypothetical protein
MIHRTDSRPLARAVALASLALLLLAQILLSLGPEFLYGQHPVDFAHGSLLLAAMASLAFRHALPKGFVNGLATSLAIPGAFATAGMCALDMVLWSYGEDGASRDALIRHLMETPVVWMPFMVIGPALLYAGLATHAWATLRRRPLPSILAIVGSVGVGLGHFLWQDRAIVVAACVAFVSGLGILVLRTEPEPAHP